MDDQQTIVLLDLSPAFPLATSPRTRIPSAEILFKQIEYEAQAKRELRKKQNQSNVYQKIKKALSRKLGNGRYMRGMSANQELRIKQMIQTCNQRKHIRARNLSNGDFGSQTQRNRNYSAKQSARATYMGPTQYSRPQTARPKTSKPLSPRPQTSKRSSQTQSKQQKSQQCERIFYNGRNYTNNQNKKMKKQSKTKPFLKMQFQKENINPSTLFISKTESTNLIYDQGQFSPPTQQYNNTTDGRKRKNKLILKNRFKNIIDNCDNQKEQIICLGKKIGHFQYFCKKMTDKKSHIQKFCKKMEIRNALLDQSFS